MRKLWENQDSRGLLNRYLVVKPRWVRLANPHTTTRGIAALTRGFRIGSVPIVNGFSFVVFICLGLAASGLHAALGQSKAAEEWPTGSFDQQRDAWQRTETKFTVDNAKDIKLLWKLKTDNKSMGMQSFREPLIVAGVQTAAGVKTLAIVAGSSDEVYTVDVQGGSLVPPE